MKDHISNDVGCAQKKGCSVKGENDSKRSRWGGSGRTLLVKMKLRTKVMKPPRVRLNPKQQFLPAAFSVALPFDPPIYLVVPRWRYIGPTVLCLDFVNAVDPCYGGGGRVIPRYRGVQQILRIF